MSEAIPGIGVPPVAPAAPAAVAILWRPGPKGTEICWLLRAKTLRFAGGFHALPGGRVDASDAQVPVQGASGDAAMLRAAAARELFEEVGILAARGSGVLPDAAARRALLDGQASFAELLASRGLELVAEDWVEAGRWVTPEWAPRRFDTHFFLVRLPEGQQIDPWVGELTEGGWSPVSEALARWEAGKLLLHPPQLHVLRALATHGPGDEGVAALRAGAQTPDFIPATTEFQRGVRALALRTATLAPATHTHCYLVGEGELLIVDPGSGDPAELSRLDAQLEALEARGTRPVAVVLTHHHGDHVSGARAVAARRRLPIWCHPWTADHLGLTEARRLQEGEVLTLGASGPFPTRWQVFHTPGHAPGHLCLHEPALRTAVVGDMVAGLGTILIDPDEGDMAAYLRELGRLRDLGVRTLHPAHGAPFPHAGEALEALIAHRLQREARVFDALSEQPQPSEAISASAYADSPTAHPMLAERSTCAHLIKLEREGRAVRDGEGWRRA
ncbi:MAG TPA: MBL fold metallo-hydrolase [Myxococcaceae bacterium]|nr:MBL fold metallo-hydrolase [Myxococcaceae bacterium]